jgi:hypothetical protein
MKAKPITNNQSSRSDEYPAYAPLKVGPWTWALLTKWIRPSPMVQNSDAEKNCLKSWRTRRISRPDAHRSDGVCFYSTAQGKTIVQSAHGQIKDSNLGRVLRRTGKQAACICRFQYIRPLSRIYRAFLACRFGRKWRSRCRGRGSFPTQLINTVMHVREASVKAGGNRRRTRLSHAPTRRDQNFIP